MDRIKAWCGRPRARSSTNCRSGEVTPLDLLDVLEKRIAEVDGKVNALPTLCFDRARKHARALMEKPAGERGLLAGLPVPIKDLTDVAGVLTTQGSPIFKDNVAGNNPTSWSSISKPTAR